jgi:hypothetical protein
MVLKKLGDEQWEVYLRVLRYLGQEEGMHVVVEPHEYLKLSRKHPDMEFVDTYNSDEGDRCAPVHWLQLECTKLLVGRISHSLPTRCLSLDAFAGFISMWTLWCAWVVMAPSCMRLPFSSEPFHQ